MNKPVDSDWTKTRSKYLNGLVFTTLLCFACLIWPGYKSKVPEKDFIKETKVLKEKPIFKKERKRKTTSYFIDIVFVGENEVYKIEEGYEFLKKEEFINDVNSGDTVLISRNKNSIKYFSKGEKEYLDYRRAETNRSNTILFIGLLTFPMLIMSGIVSTLSKRPTYQNGENFPLHHLMIIIFIVSFLLLKLFIDFEFITKGEFVN